MSEYANYVVSYKDFVMMFLRNIRFEGVMDNGKLMNCSVIKFGRY